MTMSRHGQTTVPQQIISPAAQGLYDPAYEHDACGVGFVAHIKGVASRQIVDDAERILRHMTHRGACGCEENTGDGAGILTALPDAFLRKAARRDLGIELPEVGAYAAGIVFLPTDPEQREDCRQAVNEMIEVQGQRLLGWRPTTSLNEGIRRTIEWLRGQRGGV